MQNVRIDATPRDADADTFAPVFVVGAHRSGTSALYRALAETGDFSYFTAADIVAINAARRGLPAQDEVGRLAEICERLATRLIDDMEITPEFPEEYGFLLPERRLSPENIAEFRAACASLPNGHGGRVLLKNPWELGNLGYIKQAFAGAKFVVIHRNPADIVASQRDAVTRLILNGSAYHDIIDPRAVKLAKIPAAARALLRTGAGSTVFALVLMTRLRIHLARLTDALDEFGSENFIELRFEDLSNDQKKILGGVHDFLGLETPPALNGIRKGRNNGRGRLWDSLASVMFRDYAKRYGY
jgi:hypothetical protein